MIGQGGPKASRAPVARFTRALPWLCRTALLLIFYLVGTSSSRALADDVNLHLRFAWGGGTERIWHGSVRLSEGTFSELHALGIEADEKFEERMTTLSTGDLLLFYTDGITEARDPMGRLFEEHRLDEALHASPESAEQTLRNILIAVDDFTRGLPLTDDRLRVAKRFQRQFGLGLFPAMATQAVFVEKLPAVAGEIH